MYPTIFALSNDWVIAFFLNFLIILIAQRFPLLTKQGWIHAGVLGTILLGCIGWSGWFAVVIYFFFGTLVTKIGFKYKKSLGLSESRNGVRGPENLWGSAATGTLFAILIKLYPSLYDNLILAFAASFISKLSDTFGSEIGKRWGRKTYLITNFELVPKGTEGAISIQGTLASLAGSIIMTLSFSLIGLVPFEYFYVLTSIGFLATLLESILGVLVQGRSNLLTNEFVNFIQTLIAALMAFIYSFLINK